MCLPYDEALGIHPQDDSFLRREALGLRRHAAGQLPAAAALPPAGDLPPPGAASRPTWCWPCSCSATSSRAEEKRRDFDYYDPLTTGDSSLSRCIFSIVASEVGYPDKAYAYFMETRAHGPRQHPRQHAQYGVHTAAMAGTWLGVVYGFAGMRPGWRRAALRTRAAGTMARLPLQAARARRAAGSRRSTPAATSYRLLRGRALALIAPRQRACC